MFSRLFGPVCEKCNFFGQMNIQIYIRYHRYWAKEYPNIFCRINGSQINIYKLICYRKNQRMFWQMNIFVQTYSNTINYLINQPTLVWTILTILTILIIFYYFRLFFNYFESIWITFDLFWGQMKI